jgi:hypothetical protein
MTEFLTAAELRALEKVIAKARAEPGTHHQPTRSGEVVAFLYINEIKWVVSHRRAKVAYGTILLVRRKAS